VEAARHHDVADLARADQLGRLDQKRRRAPVNAYLRDPARLARHLDHAPPLIDRERQRLFDVDILARAAGIDEHQRVPVIRRRDHHRVHILDLEQAPVIFEAPRRQPPLSLLGLSPIQIIVSQIAEGDRFLVAVLEEGVLHLVATVAEADVADADAVVGAKDSGIAERGGAGRAGEISAGQFSHLELSFRRGSHSQYIL